MGVISMRGLSVTVVLFVFFVPSNATISAVMVASCSAVNVPGPLNSTVA